MFGYGNSNRPLGSRRLGGPVLLKDLLPALLEELHEVYVERGGPAPLDAVLAVAGTLGAEERAFSRAA